ncbi:Alpha-glucosidase 2 [Linum perenne]
MGLLPLSITTTAHQLHCHGVKLVPPFPLPSLTYRRHHRPHLPLPFPSAPASSASFPRCSRPPKETRLFLQMANSQGDSTQDVRSGDMIFQPILEEGVFRFDCSVDDRAVAFPSVSFVNAKDRDTPIANVAKSVPSFIPTFKCGSGNQTVQLQLPDGTSFYGSGEVSGQLERTGKRVFTWNTDAWGYGPGTTSLYQSHPWVLAILPNGEAIGLLADTTKRCEIDLRTESVVKFIAPSSYPIISFGPFPSPTAVLRCLSHAIGTVFMPPKWSLGYQQCRWSYDSAKRVQEVAKIFREKEIPCDVIWMDIDYMEGFRCFTFDQERFPDPRSLTKDLHDMGFKAIWMLDPGIKREEGYFVYDSGSKSDVWVQNANGQPYIGEVWPGPCVFPDFTQSKVRSWWASLVREFVSNGVDGIWNDMNEPAVFKTVTKTMPETNIHRGDDELGGCQNHLQYHNVYGMLMARSTYEGMKSSNENKRPFVLTRAGFIGSQRYAATWTGDNLSNWEHLQMSIAMVLQLGLSGQPLSGPDLGGFAGNATPKLFGRWMGIGSLFPFCRGHSEKGTTDHEPWSFGEECEEVCRLALRRRYRLIPYIYTLFYMWLQSRIDIDGYEEYSGTEYRSAGCSEAYSVIERDLVHAGEEESLMLECDIGGGVVLQRHVSILKDRPDILQIESAIVARSVGAGSGGFSRLVCLRVHPTFTLLHPTETFVSFTSVDGSKHEIWPDSGNQTYQGDHRPNGEWMLVDRCSGLGLVNRFNVNEVFKCYIHWGTKTVNLELWSEDRPVSKQSPLTVSHQYEVARIASS